MFLGALTLDLEAKARASGSEREMR